MIKQDELSRFSELMGKYKVKEEKMKQAKAIMDDMETVLIVRLEQGESIEKGELNALVRVDERRTVSWKQIVEDLKGKAFCEKALADTIPSKTKHVNVVKVREVKE